MKRKINLLLFLILISTLTILLTVYVNATTKDYYIFSFNDGSAIAQSQKSYKNQIIVDKDYGSYVRFTNPGSDKNMDLDRALIFFESFDITKYPYMSMVYRANSNLSEHIDFNIQSANGRIWGPTLNNLRNNDKWSSFIVNLSLLNWRGGEHYYCQSWQDLSETNTVKGMLFRPFIYQNDNNYFDILFLGFFKSYEDASSFTYDPESIKSKHQNSINGNTTNSVKYQIYQNINTPTSVVDSYLFAQNVSVTNSIDSGTSDAIGAVTLKQDKGNITITHNGYLNRTIPSARANKTGKIYLQRDYGMGPILQAVWVDDIDVYNEEYKIDLLSKESITLEAEVVWKTGQPNKIYLMQKQNRVEFIGNTLSTILSDNFDLSNDIFIVCEDTEGNTTKKKLKVKADSNKYAQILSDYKFSLGDSVTGTIPSSIPVFGDTTIAFDAPLIPLTVTFENNKFYGVLGLDVIKAENNYTFYGNINGNSKSKFENTTKYLSENIKESLKKSKDKYNLKKLKSNWKKALYNYSAKVGFTADMTVLGYVEGYVTNTNDVVILDAGVGVNPSVELEFGSQIWPWPPVFWEAAIKGEIEAMLNLYLNETAKNFTPSGSLGGKIGVAGGVGLGASGVIGISGGIEGELGINWEIYKDRRDYVAITGSFGAYAKGFVGPLELKKDFKFAEGIIWDHPSTRVSSLALYDDGEFYSPSAYSLVDRSYLDSPSVFNSYYGGKDYYGFTVQNRELTELKSNVYTYPEPQIAELTDGRILAVWLDDDITRSDINRTALYCSVYDGAWCEPVMIDDDGTADFSPSVSVINDIPYLVWVDSNAILENTAASNEIFGTWEISVAKFDLESGEFGEISILTENDCIDLMPKIYGDGEEISAVWVSNADNDIFAPSSTYSVMTASLSDNAWSAPHTFASGLSAIDSIDATYLDGEEFIAYCIDFDGDQSDYTDKEIYLNGERITENEILDSKPVFANGQLYYYSNGSIVEFDLTTGESDSVATISTDRFKIVTSNDSATIVYTEADSLKNELYAIIYDGEAGLWGERIALTALNKHIQSFMPTYTQSGTIALIAGVNEVISDSDSGDPYGNTDLVYYEITPICNLSIGEVLYNDELLVGGNNLELSTEIVNNGELTVNAYTVAITAMGGEIISESYITDPLLPGTRREVSLYYKLDSDFAPHSVKITVMPDNSLDEYDDTDNSTTVTLSREALSLEKIGYGINTEGDAVIYADVVNRGYGSHSDISVSLRKNSPDGEAIDTITINETLNSLDLYGVDFVVPYEENVVYYVTIDGELMDSDFVIIKKLDHTIVYGDADGNGETDSSDSVILSRHLAKWTGYSESDYDFNGCDLDLDLELTPVDSTILSRYLAKWTGYLEIPIVD